MHSNYPGGFANGVTIRDVPIINSHPGKVYWVSNASTLQRGQRGGSNSNKGTYDSPFSTLAYAVTQCIANRGDVIFIKPGHAEAISSATALTLSIAGVAIIGLGLGAIRPTFTLDTATTATINVTAANIAIKNCIFSANFADIVSFFTLTTAKNFTLEGNLFKATATNMNSLYVVDTNATTADCDGLSIIGNKWIEPDTATLSMIKMDGTNDNITVTGNYLSLGVNNNKAAIAAIATGKIITNADIGSNRVFRLNTDSATGALLVTTDGSTNTGMIYSNFVQHADTAAEVLVTASAGFGVFQNFASGVAGASGYLLPAADS